MRNKTSSCPGIFVRTICFCLSLFLFFFLGWRIPNQARSKRRAPKLPHATGVEILALDYVSRISNFVTFFWEFGRLRHANRTTLNRYIHMYTYICVYRMKNKALLNGQHSTFGASRKMMMELCEFATRLVPGPCHTDVLSHI